MKNIKVVLLMMLAFVVAVPASVFARSKAKRVVLIALDGISVPGFTQAHTPNLELPLHLSPPAYAPPFHQDNFS